MSTYLVTGAAGFIASKVCEFLLAEGHTVVGIDNLNDYYDVRLKDYRLGRLLGFRAAVGSGRSTVDGGQATVDRWRPGNDPKMSMYAGAARLSTVDGARLRRDGGQSTVDSLPTTGRFIFEPLDVENLAGLEALFVEFNFDAVFNLAARAGVRYSMEHPHVYMSTNAQGTLNLLECQRKHGVKKHVLASTSSLYAGCPMPFTEDQPVNTPLSPYAATKKAAEAMAYSYHHLYGIDVSVVRYFTVYGPAGRPDMAPYRFVHWIATGKPIKLFGDGNQTRDFTYVDDIARGTILAARVGAVDGARLRRDGGRSTVDGGRATVDGGQGAMDGGLPTGGGLQSTDHGLQSTAHSGYEVINIGGGNRPITINAMISLIERELNEQSAALARTSQLSQPQVSSLKSQVSPPPVAALSPQASPFRAVIDRHPANPVDMTDTSADISKARRMLGWSPEVSPEEGFKRTVAWYLENRDWLAAVEVESDRSRKVETAALAPPAHVSRAQA